MNKDRLKQLVGIAFVNLATLAWASNMVFGRVLKDAVGPVTISSFRFLVAFVIFSILLRRQSVKDRTLGNDRWLLAAMAIAGVVIFSPLLYLGLHFTTVANGTIINGMAPLLTGLFATLLLKESMSVRQVGGAMCALAGVLILISGGSWDFWQNANFNTGDLIILIAVTFWGLYSVIGSKVMRNRSSVSATAFSTFMGLPVLFVLAFWELQTTPLTIDGRVLSILVYLGVVPTAIGFYAWNAGVARLGPSGAMVFYNTLPLYGAVLGFLFLGETIGMPHIIGGMLIVSGGLWAARNGVTKQIRTVPRWKYEPEQN